MKNRRVEEIKSGLQEEAEQERMEEEQYFAEGILIAKRYLLKREKKSSVVRKNIFLQSVIISNISAFCCYFI